MNKCHVKIGVCLKRLSGTGRCTKPGYVGIVREITPFGMGIEMTFDDGAEGTFWFNNTLQWELHVIDPICEAKSLLEKEGYTITPPKPKLTGKVVIYHSRGQIFTCTEEDWKNYVGKYGHAVLAIVDWTEGDGL